MNSFVKKPIYALVILTCALVCGHCKKRRSDNYEIKTIYETCKGADCPSSSELETDQSGEDFRENLDQKTKSQGNESDTAAQQGDQIGELGDPSVHLDDVLRAKEELSAQAILGSNKDLDHINADLILSSQWPVNVTVTWQSSIANIKTNGSVVTPAFPENPVSGKLVATLTKGKVTVIKQFNVTVLPAEPTDSQAVNASKSSLEKLPFLGSNRSLDRIVFDLALPDQGDFGTTLKWKSANSAITDQGKVTRPDSTSGPSIGDLDATITRNQTILVLSFKATVAPQKPNLLITELYTGGYILSGWVEIHNPTESPVSLKDFSLRCCSENRSDCDCSTDHALPDQVIEPDGFLLLHPGTGSQVGDEIDGSNEVFLDYFVMDASNGAIDITKDGKTVDFVRWKTPESVSAVEPTTGSFLGTLAVDSTELGTSFGISYPFEDLDSSEDWEYFAFATPGGPNFVSFTLSLDSDGDGLSDNEEITVYQTDPTNSDTDDDGFPDGAEVLDSGISGINIKAMGANPLVRDIFVEIDFMAQPPGESDDLKDSTLNAYAHQIRKAALDRVKETFASYVPQQVVGSGAAAFPLAIHIDVGDLFDGKEGINPANYDLGGGNEIPFHRCTYIGVDASRDSENCSNLYQLKQVHFDIARKFVFHYFLFTWSQDPAGGIGASGLAEIHGNDGLMSMGNWGGNASSEQMLINFQAATLLHELGHNLGLQHGGGDSINYKPNYKSSMNYLYQLHGIDVDDDGDVFYYVNNYSLRSGYTLDSLDNDPTSASFIMDYSKGKFPSLNEAALDEEKGWNESPIDFDNSGAFEQNISPTNINPQYDTTSDGVHVDHDDWGALEVRFQTFLYSDYSGVSFVGGSDKQKLSHECGQRPDNFFKAMQNNSAPEQEALPPQIP